MIINSYLRLTEEGIENIKFRYKKSIDIESETINELEELFCLLFKSIPRFFDYFNTNLCFVSGSNCIHCGEIELTPYLLKLSELEEYSNPLYNLDTQEFFWGDKYIIDKSILGKLKTEKDSLPISNPPLISIYPKQHRLPIPFEFVLSLKQKDKRDLLWEGDIDVLRNIQELFKKYAYSIVDNIIKEIQFGDFIISCTEEDLKVNYPSMYDYYINSLYDNKTYRVPSPSERKTENKKEEITIDIKEMEKRFEKIKKKIEL